MEKLVQALFGKRSESVMEEAEQQFADGNLDRASELCETLIKRGYSGGWELKAQVLASQDQTEAAHDVLLEFLNLYRSGAGKEAREQAELVHVRHLVRAGLFPQLNQLAEAPWEIDSTEVLGVAADECLKNGRIKEGREFAVRLARMNHDEHAAFWYIREADGIYTDDTRMWKLTIGGRSELNEKYTMVPYHVAARNTESALEFIRELEPSIPELSLVKVQDEKKRPGLPQGVYWRGPWISGSE